MGFPNGVERCTVSGLTEQGDLKRLRMKRDESKTDAVVNPP